MNRFRSVWPPSLVLALGPWLALLLLLGLHAPAGAAPADTERAQTIVHMLDYVGVDYPEFVQDGEVLNADEYEEQREFATQVIALMQQLPAVPGQADLLQQAHALLARIEAKAAGAEVAALAGQLRQDMIGAYKLSIAPRQAPDLVLGARLFGEHCASCHGVKGQGDGPLAAGMEPAPSDFHDEARMRQRSLYGLYNTISLGVGGTSMRAFAELSESERWALAFFAGSLRATPELLARGEAAWREGQGRALQMRTLVGVTPGEQAKAGTALDAVRAYLTHAPQALQAAAPAPLTVSRATLDEALQAYRRGEHEEARRLAIAAYLEGFELVEAALNNVDAPLRVQTEREMMALRAAIAAGQSVEAVSEQVEKIKALLERADEALSSASLSTTAAFVSSLLILLREGLEAILVLAAIIAFVRKTERHDALPWIHVGWLAALALGIATWALARYAIRISGANRELTEGVTALLAAAMLLYVGWWLHNKSNTKAWHRYIKDKVGGALGSQTLWVLAGISFLAVYRELFEIILFYETLLDQVGPQGHPAVWGGVVAAAALLVIIGGAILKYSVKLPIGPFFSVTAMLLAFMAVVFAGNGIAALQEAGVFDATFVRFITVPVLGIHPTVQGLVTQACVLALVLGVVVWGRMRMARVAAQ